MKYYFKSNNLNNIEKHDYELLKEFTINNLARLEADYSRAWCLGYQTFGIFLVGFAKWINLKKTNDNLDNLLFFSRDGYLIMQAYNKIFNENTLYFNISRRSCSFPSSSDYKDLFNNLILPPTFDLEILFKALDLDYQKAKVKAKLLNIDLNKKYTRKSFRSDRSLFKLVECFKKELNDKIVKQKSNFKKYLKQKKVQGKVGVVDVGWHCSIQKSLISIISDKFVNIKGYYAGIYDDAYKFKNGNSADGYIFEYGNNKNLEYKVFSFVSLFESFFLAHEGTTIKYTDSSNIIEPILAEYEYSNKDNNLGIISDFQKGALKFVDDYIDSDLFGKINLNNSICFNSLLELGTNPYKCDINLFENLIFENYTNNNIINYNHNVFYYLIHLKELKNDFYKSGWRIVFLRKLLKVPLPYNIIFRSICKLFKRG